MLNRCVSSVAVSLILFFAAGPAPAGTANWNFRMGRFNVSLGKARRMCRRSMIRLGALVLLIGLSSQEAQAQFNPNGFIRTDGWNFLGPLLNPFGDDPAPEVMKRNWIGNAGGTIAIQNASFNPRAGDQHDGSAPDFASIHFGDVSPSPGYDLGGLAVEPIWLTTPFLEAAFGLPPGTIPSEDRVDYGDSAAGGSGIIGFLNTQIIPFIPGATAIPIDNVMCLATTYVRNNGPTIAVDLCTGSDDSIQVWVNNRCVLNKSIPRVYVGGCQEITTAILPHGVSKIATLTWEGGGGHNFGLGIRLAGSGGNLADGNGIIDFLGPGAHGDGLSGQEQPPPVFAPALSVVGFAFLALASLATGIVALRRQALASLA